MFSTRRDLVFSIDKPHRDAYKKSLWKVEDLPAVVTCMYVCTYIRTYKRVLDVACRRFGRSQREEGMQPATNPTAQRDVGTECV
jgi:hypothetical protein